MIKYIQDEIFINKNMKSGKEKVNLEKYVISNL